MKSKIIARFAPSPTGYFHIGGARTALFIYLFVRQNQGQYILRIEDTDKERSRLEYEKDILENLSWLGLEHDKLIRQSDNLDYHRACLKKLIDNDQAYLSQEELGPVEKEKGFKSEVIRFRNPNKKITFFDLIHGEITFNTTDLGDFVIAKDLDTPLFHLANVADDIQSGVTHIIRGEEHISNTPRQILLFEALGSEITPTYAHIPLILDSKRAKLSKRHHGESVWVKTYRDRGYLPEALNNYLALLGWSPQAGNDKITGTNNEILSLEDLLKRFDLRQIQKGGAVFDQVKLDWVNREYLKSLPITILQEKLSAFIPSEALVLSEILVERISCLQEAKEIIERGEFNFFFSTPNPSKELLKEGEFLPTVIELLSTLPAEDFSTDKIKEKLWDFATTKGRAKVLWPLRVALTGQEKSPDPFTVASLLGKQETLNRLEYAKKLFN